LRADLLEREEPRRGVASEMPGRAVGGRGVVRSKRLLAVKPGDILCEKYRIDALIGRGGMGQVFAATDLRSNADVAIKVVGRQLVDDVLTVRLHREAEAAQRIRSDFVPRVLEVSDTEEGETFLVMQRLVGEPLSQRIRNEGALSWSEVRSIGEDILRGLIDAHTAGIVHRDLKPSNVFLANEASRVRAMVLDFGVCKMDGLDAERLTGTGESIGTVAYMAPEQIRGAARVDERADLFAFGVLVFEMLCGRLPHEGQSQMAILASKLENPAARLRDCSRVAIPDGADELVMRAIQRDPARRFATAQELLKAWRALSSKPDGMTVAGSTPPPRPASGDTTVGADPPTEVSRPPPALLALSLEVPGDEVERPPLGPLEPTYAPPAASRRGTAPADLHPTQTSLTTHHISLHRTSGGARAALVLAVGALVAGLAAAAVSFTRGPDPSRAPSAMVSAVEPASMLDAPPTSFGTALAAPAAAKESASSVPADTVALAPPAEPAPTEAQPAGEKPRPARPRTRHPVPPKSSGPRITAQPRY
jgi:eukaryotic-like serine/threonine-protein kinase